MIATPGPLSASASIPHPLGSILLAEDDPEFRDLVACYLRRRGYRVFSVRDGGALLDRLGASPPYGGDTPVDLVVSDVYMPSVDGLRVLRGLHEERRPIPFVLMTAFGDDHLHEEARRNGAYAVLDKPFELGLLLATIDRALFGAPS